MGVLRRKKVRQAFLYRHAYANTSYGGVGVSEGAFFTVKQIL